MNTEQLIAMIPDDLRPLTSVHEENGYTQVAVTIEGWGVVEFDCYGGERVYTYARFESLEPKRMGKAVEMVIELMARAKEYDDSLWTDTHYHKNL